MTPAFMGLHVSSASNLGNTSNDVDERQAGGLAHMAISSTRIGFTPSTVGPHR